MWKWRAGWRPKALAKSACASASLGAAANQRARARKSAARSTVRACRSSSRASARQADDRVARLRLQSLDARRFASSRDEPGAHTVPALPLGRHPARHRVAAVERRWEVGRGGGERDDAVHPEALGLLHLGGDLGCESLQVRDEAPEVGKERLFVREEARFVHPLLRDVPVELAQKKVGLFGERGEGGVQAMKRSGEASRVAAALRPDERGERVADLDQHRGLESARPAHRGLDLGDGPLRGLAHRGEPVREAAQVEVGDACHVGGVVRALEISPGHELVEVAVEVGVGGEVVVEPGARQPLTDVGWPELDLVPLPCLGEDLHDRAVVGRVLGGDVPQRGDLVEEAWQGCPQPSAAPQK